MQISRSEFGRVASHTANSRPTLNNSYRRITRTCHGLPDRALGLALAQWKGIVNVIIFMESEYKWWCHRPG